MPAPMWAVIGIVEQWYIHTPARVAVNRYTNDSPGWMVRIGRSGASAPAWKSMECPIGRGVDQRHLEHVADCGRAGSARERAR